MDETADLQAQMVALRLAVEGLWMSLLRSGPDAVAQAERLRRENVAAIGQLDADTAQARALRDAVAAHTDQLWGSIGWQLQQGDPPKSVCGGGQRTTSPRAQWRCRSRFTLSRQGRDLRDGDLSV